jgi:hypothetical protein
MKPEKQNLIRDVLEDNSTREATLLAGAQILRRRRHWRAARQIIPGLVLVAVVAGWLLRKETKPSPQLAVVTPKAPPVSQVHEMTDDELLALFPNTPVALASLPDGKKRLLFPRAGDEQKYIKRL